VNILSGAMRPSHKSARSHVRLNRERVRLQLRQIAHCFRNQQPDSPRRTQRLHLAHYIAIERHEHAIVLHAGFFDNARSALFELLVVDRTT
jgi:hypothetical protein